MAKSTALITLPKRELAKTGKQVKPVKINMASLEATDQMFKKMLEMYNQQNFEMLRLRAACNKLMLENEELKMQLKAMPQGLPAPQTPEVRERKLPAIGYDKLKRLAFNLTEIFGAKIKRTKYANALVHMLFTLHQLKGKATPMQLFTAADLTEITGYRYSSFLKEKRFLEYNATNKQGYYTLTESGKLFMEEKLTTPDEFAAYHGIKYAHLLGIEN